MLQYAPCKLEMALNTEGPDAACTHEPYGFIQSQNL